MPVVSTVERVGRTVRETLDRLAAPDDLVEFAVGVDVDTVDVEDQPDGMPVAVDIDPPEACDDCGHVHVTETVIAIFISLDCPETNSRAQSHWYCPIRQTYDEVELIDAIEKTWERLTSRRQFYALDCGLVASTDEATVPESGKD